MATRPVFVARDYVPFVEVWTAEFDYAPGFAAVQQQKNVAAIHEAFTRRFPQKRVLEISSKSLQEGGRELSAFSLKLQVPSLGRSVPVECAFQAGKVFEKGGPYLDLLAVAPKAAKGDPRLKASGGLTGFTFEGQSYPLLPKTAFYDFLYVNALLQNPQLADVVRAYDAFTDIAFNPARGVNCQARAAALFVSADRLGRLDACRDFGSFLEFYGVRRS